MANTLYFGDNLHVLRQYIKDESVDLVYLDPPFNSKVSYNVLYKTPAGQKSRAQVHAFEDAWNWGDVAEIAYSEVLKSGTEAAGILRALRGFLGQNDMMAYLAMMAVRLVELRRVLKSTGSLYLHCDPTASHYLKIILDGIFGSSCFRNEIIWKRSHAHSDGRQGAKHFGRISDTILFYARSEAAPFKTQYTPYEESYIDRDYRRVDVDGRRYRLDNIQGPGGAEKGNPFYEVMGVSRHWRYSKEKMQKLIEQGRIIQTTPGAVPQYKRYLDEMPGIPLQNIWTDMPGINNRSEELLGYPTQKPLSLLERIIESSSNIGDVILDPFCGCGTAIHAAIRLDRRYIGIDITHVAIQIIQDRIKKYFPQEKIEIIGRPKDLEGAFALAEHDKYQFQWWATWLAGGQPRGGQKKGADKGVDGEIYFKTGLNRDGFAVISVKGGQNITPAMVSELCEVRRRENADVGIFICLKEPTREMRSNASTAGIIDGQYPVIQILTIEQLLDGHRPKLPPVYDTSTIIAASNRRGRVAKAASPEELRRQPQFSYPIAGGKQEGRMLEAAEDPAAYEVEPSKKRGRAKKA
jgi:DNA modification methylase